MQQLLSSIPYSIFSDSHHVTFFCSQMFTLTPFEIYQKNEWILHGNFKSRNSPRSRCKKVVSLSTVSFSLYFRSGFVADKVKP
jgi:hypothetical protein